MINISTDSLFRLSSLIIHLTLHFGNTQAYPPLLKYSEDEDSEHSPSPFVIALAICVKASRAQSEGGAPSPGIETSTDSEVDSNIDQKDGESGNEKRWRVMKKAAAPKIERYVPGMRFYYPSTKKRQTLESDTDTEAEASWKIFQRSEDEQMDYCKYRAKLYTDLKH